MEQSNTELKRSLGLIDATSIAAGSMIGSGIFIVTTFMARDLGSSGWVLLTWLISGVITVFAALSYGELAAMMPTAGGQYIYIQRAYGRIASFLYGWTVFSVIQTGIIAAVAVAFSKYTAVFFPVLTKTFLSAGSIEITYMQLLAVVSVFFLTYLNSLGVQNGKVIQVIFTAAKLFALFALIVLGLAVGLKSDTLAQNFVNMWAAAKTTVINGVVTQVPLSGIALAGAIGVTIVNSLFSSDSWNNVTFVAGEIKDPKKNIPRSLFLGTVIVTIIYMLANIAYMALLPLHGNPNAESVIGQGIMFADHDRVGTAAVSVILGSSAAYIMAALIMISTFGCNNGIILSGARLYYAMAKDGLFFKKAGQLNKSQVPAKALWLQCIWASMLCLSGKYNELVEYATFSSLLFYIITVYGLIILRKKEPHTPRPYKAIGYPVIPLLYIIIGSAICLALLVYHTKTTLLGVGIVLLGVPIYYFTQKNT